jgi:hypothetical protein
VAPAARGVGAREADGAVAGRDGRDGVVDGGRDAARRADARVHEGGDVAVEAVRHARDARLERRVVDGHLVVVEAALEDAEPGAEHDGALVRVHAETAAGAPLGGHRLEQLVDREVVADEAPQVGVELVAVPRAGRAALQPHEAGAQAVAQRVDELAHVAVADAEHLVAAADLPVDRLVLDAHRDRLLVARALHRLTHGAS